MGISAYPETPRRCATFAIPDYIAARSPQGAKRIQAIIDRLLLHPHIGTRTDNPAIRRLATPPYPYVIFYEATETEIINHAMRHQARNPSGMPGSA